MFSFNGKPQSTVPPRLIASERYVVELTHLALRPGYTTPAGFACEFCLASVRWEYRLALQFSTALKC